MVEKAAEANDNSQGQHGLSQSILWPDLLIPPLLGDQIGKLHWGAHGGELEMSGWRFWMIYYRIVIMLTYWHNQQITYWVPIMWFSKCYR